MDKKPLSSMTAQEAEELGIYHIYHLSHTVPDCWYYQFYTLITVSKIIERGFDINKPKING